MMKKKQSHWWRMAWMGFTIPLICLSLMAFDYTPNPPTDIKSGDIITGNVSDTDGHLLEYANIVEEDEFYRMWVIRARPSISAAIRLPWSWSPTR